MDCVHGLRNRSTIGSYARASIDEVDLNCPYYAAQLILGGVPQGLTAQTDCPTLKAYVILPIRTATRLVGPCLSISGGPPLKLPEPGYTEVTCYSPDSAPTYSISSDKPTYKNQST